MAHWWKSVTSDLGVCGVGSGPPAFLGCLSLPFGVAG